MLYLSEPWSSFRFVNGLMKLLVMYLCGLLSEAMMISDEGYSDLLGVGGQRIFIGEYALSF